ncbi:MAG: glycoside hydrolase family 31 protein [Myxococcales bacterium]|nr:glycoside hydrolase family 31 protein [Myxococcales bacterium]
MYREKKRSLWRGLSGVLGILCMCACLVWGTQLGCDTTSQHNDGGETVPEGVGDGNANTVTLQQGRSSLLIETPWTLRLMQGTTEQMTLPLEGLQLGVVDPYKESYNFDPWWLYEHDGQKGIQPPGLRWLSPEKASLQKKTENSATYTLSYASGMTATLEIAAQEDGIWKLHLLPNASTPRVVWVRIRHPAAEKENYYGLGEYFDSVAHRGKLRPMQIEVDLKMESGYNEAHIPIPFFTSTRGWGLLVDSYFPATFDMAAREKDTITTTFHTDKDLTFYLLSAEHPLDVPGLYTRITGAPSLPARWAFGTMLWRDENKDQAEVLEDAAQIRKNDLAISVMWIDRPYDTAVNNFGFDTKLYPDASGMIKQLNDNGFRVGVWSTPYLEPSADMHKFALEKNYFVKMGFQKLNKWSDPLDLSNPEIRSFWQDQIKKIRALGIEGFKLDYGEDIQVGLYDARLRYGFHNGEDERSMHHKFALYYHQTYAETLGADGGFLICRGGSLGSQRYTQIIWPGDLNTGLQKHRDPKEGGTSFYVGGLPAALIGGLSLSMSGFHFYGADTGGYRAPRTTKEDFIRWGQMTALGTIMQIGGPDPNVNPWDFTRYGQSQFDQQVLDNYKRYIRLHTRLFPYIYTYAKSAQKHQRGPTRPFGAAYPNEDHHPDDLFLLGEALLVAPIVDGKTSRSIRIPKDTTWYDWWDQKRYTAGDITYDAPLDRLPLLQRAGSIVPMLRPDIDTLSPVQTAETISMQPVPGKLYLRIAPGADSSFTLYDETQISLKDGASLELSIKQGSEFKEGTVASFVRLNKPTSVKLGTTDLQSANDQAALLQCAQGCFWWDDTNKMLYVHAPAGDQQLTIAAEQRKD